MKNTTNDRDEEGRIIGDGTDSDDQDDASNSSNHDGAPDFSAAPPVGGHISKTWTTLTTHSPCYAGGTVAFSHALSTTMMTDAFVTSPSGDDERTSSHSSSRNHFILAQRGGDVSIIEASTGLLLRTVRKGKLFQSEDYNENDEDDEDDDDEVMDAEAITAFALSPNNVDLIAVTRSHLVRKYCLAVPAAAAQEEENSKRKKGGEKNQKNKDRMKDYNDDTLVESVTSITDPAKVTFSFGKSGHSLPVTKVAFHPSGIFFATGSVDGFVKVWDVRNGYATHALHPTSSGGGGGRGRYAVSCLEWRATTTSLILAIGREDGSISIHDLLLNAHDTKTASLPVAVLRDHLSAVTSVAWTPDVAAIKNIGVGPTASSSTAIRRHGGGYFFSSGRDSVINTWLISEEEMTNNHGPKRKKKKTGGGDDKQQRQVSTIKVSYCRIRTLPVYEQVESMILLSRKFRPSSETKREKEILNKKDVVLATCGTKGVVRLWKATPSDGDGGIQNSISDLSLLASQSEGDSFGEENGGYTSLHLASLFTTHLSPMLVAVDAEHNMAFVLVQWAKDGSTLEFVTDRSIVGHNGEILDLSVIPPSCDSEINDEHTLAVATNSSQVRIFGLGVAKEDGIGNGKQHHTALSPRGLLDGHAAIVLSIDASPCGRYLVTASKDKTMRLWHIPSRKCLAMATGHTEAIGSVALSRKIGCYDVGGKAANNGAGAFAVTASKDRTLKVWPLPGSAMLNRWADGGGQEHPLNARLSARAHEKVSAIWLYR
jgi:WD40 repeat protein